jgi:cytoskeletal protein CcmA (bactofilin family)
MFSAKKKKNPVMKSLIGPETILQGDIYFGEGLHIDGRINGNIQSQSAQVSRVVISASAHVVGEVRADYVEVNGIVKGPIFASTLLELQPRAKIEGDVHYMALEMHQGAIVRGQLRPISEDAQLTEVLASDTK